MDTPTWGQAASKWLEFGLCSEAQAVQMDTGPQNPNMAAAASWAFSGPAAWKPVLHSIPTPNFGLCLGPQ